MIGSRKLAVWLVLTVVLLSWVFRDAIEHRGRVHAVGTKVVVCAGEHPHDGRAQVLDHLADCAYRAMRKL
ncbi:hypothetical protein [Kribbella sp. VKM Ac-2569]|uniref:hypothetical protein n=1 Tax=Kribbella sp. VKM Ac-2569 TaxID=2512220 RepID=UPI00102D0130|nr:hypothetical protein [Kribbella sp. VKM Ac-2569]